MLNLLLVEDNRELGSLIKEELEDEGYHCTRHTETSTITMQNMASYDIAIVDIMLPGESGISFVTRVRKTCNIGIIFLTAKSDIETKSESFGNGADDYVTKPFKMEELIMRIEALSMRLSPQDYFIFEDIYLNSNTKEGKKGDTPIHLTPNEWLVIDFLLSHHHRVVQRADIIEHVWGGEALYEMSRSLDVVIAHIRKKLTSDIIVTVPSIGYKIAKNKPTEV